MKVALEQEQREQLAKCQALLDQQAYAAAATLLSALVPDLFHQGLTQTFLELFKRLPRTEQDADPELICAAGDAWRLHNDWEAAVSCYQRAQHLAEARADRAALGRALSRRALVCWLRGDVEGALLFYRQAMEALPPANDGDVTWEELRSGYALVLSSLGRLDEAEQLLQDQLRDYQRRADAAGQCMMLHNLGMMIYLRRGDFQAAEAVLKEALHLAEKNHQRFSEAYVLNSLAYTLNWQCRPAESLRLSWRAQAIGEALGVPNIMAFACINQAQSFLEQGDSEAAGRACEQACTLLHSAQSSPLYCDVLLVQAQLQQGQCPALARETAQTALAAARLHHEHWMIGQCLLQLADLEIELHEFEAAQAALAEAFAIFERYDDRFHLLRCHLLAARAAQLRERWSELGQHLRPLLAGLNRYPFLVAKTVRILADLLAPCVQHDQENGVSLVPLAAAWGNTFAPLAVALLDDPHPQVRAWVVRVLVQHDEAWAWTILAEHDEPIAAIRSGIQAALQRAAHHPLPDLDLTCLGQFAVRQGDVLIADDRWVSLQAQLILVYLVLRGSATREELIELLWPGEDPEKAGGRLRSTIRLLRKALSPPWRPSAAYILYQNERYLLTPTIRVTSDVQRFQQSIRQAHHAPKHAKPYAYVQALNYYRGAFLPGCYNEWVIEQREQLAAEMLWVREEYAYWLLTDGRLDAAETEARAVIDVDPLRERAWHLLLRALLLQRRTVEAVKAYQRLTKLLHDELGIEPSPDIQRLIGAIHSQRHRLV